MFELIIIDPLVVLYRLQEMHLRGCLRLIAGGIIVIMILHSNWDQLVLIKLKVVVLFISVTNLIAGFWTAQQMAIKLLRWRRLHNLRPVLFLYSFKSEIVIILDPFFAQSFRIATHHLPAPRLLIPVSPIA